MHFSLHFGVESIVSLLPGPLTVLTVTSNSRKRYYVLHWQLCNIATTIFLQFGFWDTPPNLVMLSFVFDAGQPLVLEVDGPHHYRRPDNAMTGTTRYRNRALAARGYTVVTIPW